MKHTGLVHLYIGDGKGKSTAATGLAVRMAGNGHPVLFGQFLKNGPSGEITAFERFQDLIRIRRPEMRHRTFLWNQTPEQKLETAADMKTGWRQLKGMLKDESIRLFVFDELLDVLSMGIILEEDVIAALDSRHPAAEIVLTGRQAPSRLRDVADYITEMKAIKHPYEKGIQARSGVEF